MVHGSNRSWIRGLFLIVSIGWLAQPAGALDIVMTFDMTFDSGASDSPSFDPTGTGLQAIMGAVESYWQDIIETTGTLNVTYYYDDLNDPNGVLANHLNQGTSGGKPTDYRIRVDTQRWGTDRLWCFDPTPTNNSEYDMVQALVRDLTAGQKSDWYNGTPKDMLEVSFRGSATGSAPADAQNGFDLFSVMLHEMGHGLGMTANVASGETGDDDYDFDSDLVWGGTMAAERRSATNRYHLDGDNMLMFPSSGAGTRTLPSATDIFSIQAASNWDDTKIDLQRQDFDSAGGSQDWNTRSNWAGNQVPGAADEAYVRLQTSNPTVTLTANASCTSLFVGDGDNVQTSSHKLDVGGTATVDGLNSDLMVSTSGELEAATVKIQNQAEVYMTGGLVDAGRATIDSGTYLTGNTGTPTVDVQTKLTNNGTLTVTGSITTVGSIGTAATSGKLDVTYAYASRFPFNGQLNVGLGGVFRMDYFGLSIATAPTPGEVNLAGGTYVAPQFWQYSTLNASAAPSTIDSDSQFYGTSTNTLNADLQLKNAAIIYSGATFTGAGSLIVAAGATVDVQNGASLGVSVINNGTLNLGASPGVVTIGGDFTQNSAGEWNIEIAGLDNSNLMDPDFDALDVIGIAYLDGVLNVSLIDGFDPDTEDTFDVLVASAIVAGGLSLNDPTGLFSWRLEAGDTILRLVYDAMLLGDVNEDGNVDALDITPFVSALLDIHNGSPTAIPISGTTTTRRINMNSPGSCSRSPVRKTRNTTAMKTKVRQFKNEMSSTLRTRSEATGRAVQRTSSPGSNSCSSLSCTSLGNSTRSAIVTTNPFRVLRCNTTLLSHHPYLLGLLVGQRLSKLGVRAFSSGAGAFWRGSLYMFTLSK